MAYLACSHNHYCFRSLPTKVRYPPMLLTFASRRGCHHVMDWTAPVIRKKSWILGKKAPKNPLVNRIKTTIMSCLFERITSHTSRAAIDSDKLFPCNGDISVGCFDIISINSSLQFTFAVTKLHCVRLVRYYTKYKCSPAASYVLSDDCFTEFYSPKFSLLN